MHPDYVEADEGPHTPGESALWQESLLLHWYDREQGIGGWHRLGHEPNHSGGRAAIGSFVFHGPDRWQYRHNGEVALGPEDRPANGFRGGSLLRFAYEGGAAHWWFEEGPLKGHIECRNLHALIDPFPKSDELASKRFANHFEVGGRITGELTYEGKTIRVRGHGYRDHSWGPRDWSKGMPNHRWFTGVLGESTVFAAITAQAPSGNLTRVGYVQRDGELVRAGKVDVVAHMEADGVTHRGGELTLTLPDGEPFHVRFTARAGNLFQRGNVAMFEMFCHAEGHGLSGYCDAEISSNPRAGSGPILLALNGNMGQGFSEFRPLKFCRGT